MRASLLTLHHVPSGSRILYAGILLFIVLSHAVGLVQQEVRSGLSPGGIAAWYRGNADDPDATALLFAKDAHEIVDETWRRGLVDLLPAVVMLALLVRASAPRALRRGLEVAIVGALVVDLTGPALVRFGGTAFAWPVFAARLGYFVVALGVAVLCWRDLLFRPGAGPRFRTAAGEP